MTAIESLDIDYSGESLVIDASTKSSKYTLNMTEFVTCQKPILFTMGTACRQLIIEKFSSYTECVEADDSLTLTYPVFGKYYIELKLAKVESKPEVKPVVEVKPEIIDVKPVVVESKPIVVDVKPEVKPVDPKPVERSDNVDSDDFEHVEQPVKVAQPDKAEDNDELPDVEYEDDELPDLVKCVNDEQPDVEYDADRFDCNCGYDGRDTNCELEHDYLNDPKFEKKHVDDSKPKVLTQMSFEEIKEYVRSYATSLGTYQRTLSIKSRPIKKLAIKKQIKSIELSNINVNELRSDGRSVFISMMYDDSIYRMQLYNFSKFQNPVTFTDSVCAIYIIDSIGNKLYTAILDTKGIEITIPFQQNQTFIKFHLIKVESTIKPMIKYLESWCNRDGYEICHQAMYPMWSTVEEFNSLPDAKYFNIKFDNIDPAVQHVYEVGGRTICMNLINTKFQDAASVKQVSNGYLIEGDVKKYFKYYTNGWLHHNMDKVALQSLMYSIVIDGNAAHLIIAKRTVPIVVMACLYKGKRIPVMSHPSLSRIIIDGVDVTSIQ